VLTHRDRRAIPPTVARKRYAIVVTTIHVPHFLHAYLENFQNNNRADVEFIIIADVNTSPEAEAYCRSLCSDHQIDYWNPARQSEFLREFPRLDALLPWRSIQRRNLGYLIAWQRGADVMISMDDDNFLHEPDHLAGHEVVGETTEVRCVRSDTGWWNVCSLLTTDPPRRFYHRGYPLSQRWRRSQDSWHARTARVAVNAGLWLGDPDVDTITRMEEPFQVTGMVDTGPVGLDTGTWSPFNSQNTAMIRDLLPFSYLIVGGNALRGHRSGFTNFRYDDIWMSYLARPAIERMGDVITFGPPLVVQRRNQHDLLVDLDRELIPMFLTEHLVEMLGAMSLSATSYLSLYGEVIEGLRAAVSRRPALEDRERAFFTEVADGMEIWADACVRVMEGRG
jgi:hypothetical protein